MLEQSAAAPDTTRERGDSASRIANGFTGIVQQPVERGVTAQKMMLDVAVAQVVHQPGQQRGEVAGGDHDPSILRRGNLVKQILLRCSKDLGLPIRALRTPAG